MCLDGCKSNFRTCRSMALLLDAQHASLRRLVEVAAMAYADDHTRRRAER